MEMTREQIRRLGDLADRLDNILYAAKMQLPAETHLQGMTGVVRDVRNEIATLVKEVSGKDPWATNLLAG